VSESKEQATAPIAPLDFSGRRLVVSLAGRLVLIDLPARGKLTVGRGVESDVLIAHPSISRKHASLDVGDVVRVEDLGSANGTKLAGKKLAPGSPATLVPGVVLELGSVLVTLQDERDRDGDDAGDDEAPVSMPGEVVVVDATMKEVLETVRVAAGSALSVLLLGETGVGKEVFARRVHELSSRSGSELVRLNCAALVENLLEAELFGYERGAFTGATQAKPGLLEAASGGTLFLDEVGELPLATQAKLLRVLESGEVMRVGALKPRPVDVRFVSATHRDLRALVASGQFREDLFFRLDGVSIRIPPLRERRDEIPPLAARFVEDAARAAGRPAPSLAPAAVERLLAHPWTGNVRELRNVIRRSVLFCPGAALEAEDLRFEAFGASRSGGSASVGAGAGAIPSASEAQAQAHAQTLPPPSAGPAAREPTAMSAERAERRKRVIDALEKAVWNQTRAAEALGVARRTLQTWMIDLDIPRPRASRRSR
jgi:transcriptional regulator with GAF, ATPase, and Fis domain